MTSERSNAVLPAYATSANGEFSNAGSGFIVKAIDGAHWLVTVAHMPCWTEPKPNLDLANWSGGLFVLDRNGRAVGIPLLLAPDRTPICRLLASDIGEPNAQTRSPIEDVLAVELPLPLLRRAFQFHDVAVVDMSMPAPPIVEPQRVVAFGLPTPELGQPWNWRTPTQATGNLFDIQWNRYIAEMNCEVGSGFCGGPVFTETGDFVGMINGSDHETHTVTRIVPDFVIWALVNDRQLDGLYVPGGYETAPSALSGNVSRFLPLGRIIGGERPLTPIATPFPSERPEQNDAA